MREALANKVLFLGIDAMDPELLKLYLSEGKMPNMQKFIDRGSYAKDLKMLGAMPTVTPPMWTTMATGAYPMTHGITGFSRIVPGQLDTKAYNIDSRNCHAEQLWNVTAEAGKKTLVWHWPGSSWPPTSDSPNLHVVDGTQPPNVNNGCAKTEPEFILVASTITDRVIFQPKVATDQNIPCVIEDLHVVENANDILTTTNVAVRKNIISCREEGEGGMSDQPFDVVLSPIKDAEKWEFEIPEGAKEFTMLMSGGLLRRPCLILKNEAGVYDTVAIYKNKKNDKQIAVLPAGVMVEEIFDQSIKDDVTYEVYRNMRIIELREDGEYLKMWVSSALEKGNDEVWHPKELHKLITEKIGYPPTTSYMGGADVRLISEAMGGQWECSMNWNAKCLNYLLENGDYEVVFSHWHGIDQQGHMIVQFCEDKGRSILGVETYKQLLEDTYTQADRYIGQFLHFLDEGWTILMASDHAQVCPPFEPPLIGDSTGFNVRVMSELGFTVMKHDENGNETKEVDWEHTRAVNNIANHIWINLKGRDEHGIVDPADKYELEEEIMTALYGYKHPETGRRICALCIRNKDAAVLGLSGEFAGDLIYFNTEGYNYDHTDSLSTTLGVANTSVGPMFCAAGQGIKEGFETKRVIRQVDLTPTMAILCGVRMPNDCEGAPIYQILTEQY